MHRRGVVRRCRLAMVGQLGGYHQISDQEMNRIEIISLLEKLSIEVWRGRKLVTM